MNLWKNNKNKSYNLFLRGIIEQCKKESLTEKEIDNIIKKLQDKQFDEHIATIIDSVYFSQSDLCRLILGMIAGKYLKEEQIDYIDIVLTTGLRNFVDYDLEVFEEIFNTQDGLRESKMFYHDKTKLLIFSKLLNAQIFGESFGKLRLRAEKTKLSDLDEMPASFAKTVVSDRLYKYVLDCKAIKDSCKQGHRNKTEIKKLF